MAKKCWKCKGTGNVKSKHFVILNIPIAFIRVTRAMFAKITADSPGWVAEVKTCPKCKGTGIL